MLLHGLMVKTSISHDVEAWIPIPLAGSGNNARVACRLAEWVAFLHEVIIATVVMCRVCNPACIARERPRLGALYKW